MLLFGALLLLSSCGTSPLEARNAHLLARLRALSADGGGLQLLGTPLPEGGGARLVMRDAHGTAHRC